MVLLHLHDYSMGNGMTEMGGMALFWMFSSELRLSRIFV